MDERKVALTMKQIRTAVEEHFEVNIRLQTNRADIVGPRQIASYLAYRFARKSFTSIGKEWAFRHHTTVMHGVREIERRLMLSEEDELRADVAGVCARLGVYGAVPRIVIPLPMPVEWRPDLSGEWAI